MENRTFLTESCAGNNACTEDTTGLAGDQIAAVFNPENDRDRADNTVGPEDIIANVFYLNTVDGISALNCRGFNLENNSWIGVGQPLVDGVESLQILYRVELAGGGSFSYVSADDVDDWAAVSAVRVAVLVNNGRKSVPEISKHAPLHFWMPALFLLTDKHERQVYSTTITLNNVIYNNAEK